MNTNNEHIIKRFDQELRELHTLVLEIGTLVRHQLARAMQALDEGSIEIARDVIEMDSEVNALDIQADEEMIRLLAKRHPVAGDLREVITIAKAVNDLERIGDEVRKLALMTINLNKDTKAVLNGNITRDIRMMAEFVDVMLEMVMTSFDQLDLDKALETMRMDLHLEEEYKSALRRLATFVMEDARCVGQSIEVTLALRALERMGGHAKNIGGYVIFLVTGRDVRHESLETIEQGLENFLPHMHSGNLN